LLAHVAADRRPKLDVRLLDRIAAATLELGDMMGARDAYDRIAVRAADAGLVLEEGEALMRLAYPAAFIDPDRCIAACERVMHLGLTARDPQLQARALLMTAGWRILIDGWREDHGRSYRMARGVLHRLGAELQPYEVTMTSRLDAFESRYQKSLDAANETLAVAEGLWDQAPALWSKGFALMYLGRLGDAVRTMTSGLELSVKNENATWARSFRFNLAMVHCQARNFFAVHALADEVTSTARTRPLVEPWRRRTMICKGFAELSAGRVLEARQCFEELRDETAD